MSLIRLAEMTDNMEKASLRSSIESFDYATRLLIAVTARAAAAAKLPADSRINANDINIVDEKLDALSISSTEEVQEKQSPDNGDEVVQEVDASDVHEQARKIAAAQTTEASKPSEAERRIEREKQKKLLESVEVANQAAANERRRLAKEWADDVAKLCKLGKSTQTNYQCPLTSFPDPAALPARPKVSNLKGSISDLSADKHADILHDILMVSLHLPPPSKNDSADAKDVKHPPKPPANAGVYTPLARYMLFATAQILDIPPETVYATEKAQAEKLYYLMNETKKAESDGEGKDAASRTEAEKMRQTSQGAIAEDQKKRNSWKWAATGAGFLVGGVAIGLTGGLAAPLVAPLLATVTGGALSFLATSGGAVLLGTMFGVYGGGLTAFRAGRRMQGIEEFEFVKIEDLEKPGIPSLTVSIDYGLSICQSIERDMKGDHHCFRVSDQARRLH